MTAPTHPPTPPTLAFATMDEVEAFVRAFEDGTLPKSRWTHASHLVVAFWYLSHLRRDEATERLRRGIRHYNDCQGTPNTTSSGYHETLTIFWVAAVASYLAAAGGEGPRLAVLHGLLAALAARKDLWRDFYSIDLPTSVESRLGWVAPDRRPLADASFEWSAGSLP